MKCFALFNICILMAAAVFLNVACNNQEKNQSNKIKKKEIQPLDKIEPASTKPELTPEQWAERAKTAEQVKKAFEANYRIEKTATGYSLGGLRFNDSTSNAVYTKNGWTFVINRKKKRIIEITAPGVGTAKFKFNNFGNLEPLIE